MNVNKASTPTDVLMGSCINTYRCIDGELVMLFGVRNYLYLSVLKCHPQEKVVNLNVLGVDSVLCVNAFTST
jgi:hypothetical protein